MLAELPKWYAMLPSWMGSSRGIDRLEIEKYDQEDGTVCQALVQEDQAVKRRATRI